MSSTRWGTTDRVWYCELHDSLVRNAAMRDDTEDAQCDWARMMDVPLLYEDCVVRLADLTVPALDLTGAAEVLARRRPIDKTLTAENLR